MLNKLIFVLFFLIVGCSTPAAPTPLVVTATPKPTRTISVPTALPKPTATLAANESALQVFPLKNGAQWIYREVAYETIPNDVLPQLTNRQITATLLITDTVMETQTHAAYYAAKVVRERELVSATIDIAELGDYRDLLFANNMPSSKWYIFADDKIYSQIDNLDWNSLETSTLELQSPIAEGTRWYPEAQPRAQFTVDQMIPGLRAIEPAPLLQFPIGELRDCLVLHDFYNGGGVWTDFCPGIGIVGKQFDHVGTPFGSHSELLQFISGK